MIKGRLGTWTATIARTTRLIVDQCGGSIAGKQGIYHVAAAGATTRFALAAKIVELLARNHANAGAGPVKIQPASAAEFPTAAARPAYSVLSTARLTADFGIVMPPWEADLESFLHAH